MTSVDVLAMVLSSQGRYEQAEEMLRQTLSAMEPVLGKRHPDVLMSMRYLVIMLRCQCKYEQAKDILRQELSLSETVLGKEYLH